MRLCTLAVLTCSLVSSLALMLEQESCDVQRMSVDHNYANADVVLGGIFDLRRPGEDGYGCGNPDKETILAYEAARWSIDRINSQNFINGVRMGMRSYDTCYSQYRAVAAANHFYPQFSSMYCNETGKLKLGLVGAMSSWTSKAVAGLTGKFPMSMISPIAASPELSDKTRYPNFMRTAPSSSEQAKAMMAAMKWLIWERIVVVYSDNDYGRDSMKEFVRLSMEKENCVVGTIAVPAVPDFNAYKEKLMELGNYDVNGAIFFGTQPAAIKLMEAVEDVPDSGHIQWMVSSLNLNEQINAERMRGVIYVQPQFTEVTEFYDYFTNVNNLNENNPPAANPWFRDWFMQTFNCRLRNPDVNYQPYVGLSDCDSKSAVIRLAALNNRYAFVDSTIKAVYAYAAALKQAHAQTCGGQAGLCLGLQQMTPETFHSNYLSRVDLNLDDTGINSLSGLRVRFDANGDFYTAGHDYWNFHNQPSGGFFTFKNIGNYVDNVLNLDPTNLYMYNENRDAPLFNLPRSPCPANGCKNCIVPRTAVNFHYVPGDLVLTGLFDIHAQGSEVLTCGSLRATTALNVAAFRYALNSVKSEFPTILNGVDLGSLVVDLCDNAETGRLLLNDLLGGRAIISDRHGMVVDPNLVKGVVGELDSTEAMSMSSMLGHFSMPYLESSATSVLLHNREMFPTFSRAVPSDYHQMLAIVLMLKRMNWNYVQVVHSRNTYGRSAFQIINSETASRSICISASHEVITDGDHSTIVRNLQKKPDARVVIAIVDGYDYTAMLEAIQDQGVQGQFILIGAESWGTRASVVDGYEAVAEGSITLDIEGPAINNFYNWLNGLNPSDMNVYKENPYFAEWYQYAFSCYLDAKNRGMYTVQCNSNNPITTAPRFADSSYTPFMISATYAAARAIDQTLRDFCGDVAGNYDGICWQFRSNPQVKERILEYIRSSEYTLNNYMFKMFEGEGLANYVLYSYSGGQYIAIGTYRTSDMELDLNNSPLSLPLNFESECEGCSECVYLVQDRPFEIIPGKDLKIGVNFALTEPGNDPFICSDIRLTNGIQSYLAVAYALSQVNSGEAPVLLNNVDVGALIMDHCDSPARAYGLPSALYSGILESLSQDEPQPNLNTIRAWMTDNSLVTGEMKDFFTDFNLPVISPMATQNKFLNEEEYPTFVRTIQGDSTIASALAVLAKSLGLLYVNVLYSADSFGLAGMETFYTIARQEGLCIVSSMEMGSMTDDDIVLELTRQPSHVVVSYLNLADMDSFLAAKGRNMNSINGTADRLLVLSPEPYPLVYNRQGARANNILSLRMRTNTLDGYLEFVENLRTNNLLDANPRLRSYYMELFQCNLPGEYKFNVNCGTMQPIVNNADFHVDNYVLPIINAVYSFVSAAHETLKVQCAENYDGVCANFYSDPTTNTILLEKLTQIGFEDDSKTTFQFTGKEGNTGREIVLFDGTQLRKVADFAGASINILDRNLRNMFENTRSSCDAPCTSCINNAMDFTYLPGDILLGGIFDVHKSSLTAFSCGEINTLRGFQLLEAFHFAINKVNDKNGQFANVLKNIKLGGIGLDACQSSVRGGYLVSNIHNGLSVLKRNDQTIDPDTIDAYIGTYSSDRSIYLARLLKSIKMPQISYGSTSTTLTDENRYPYFLRTVPADDRQAMGMVEFLRKYDIRYVQIVHTADDYGEQGAAAFTELAGKNKVCVAQAVSFKDKSEITIENANDIVLALLQKPVANTVVVFAESEYINALLRAIRRNPDAHGKFRFVGSDAWANNIESTEGVEDIALSSVTFDLDVVDLREFDEYLSAKTPANYPENPWFAEYYEKIQNCYLTIPTSKYPKRCSAAPENIVTSQRYKQDTGIIHVINAVYAAAYGIDAALKKTCGDDYTTVCESFKNAENRHDTVLNKTKEATFVDMSNQPFSFYDRGDGKKGYVMFSIDKSNIFGHVYSPIGKYSSAGELQISRLSYAPSWDGSCERPDSCTECPSVRNLKPRYMLRPPLSDDAAPATLVFVAQIHKQGSDEYRCGDMNMGYMMRALAVMYTLQHSNLLNGFRFNLRPLILDNCNNPLRIDQDLMNLFKNGELCNEQFDWGGTTIDASTIVGVQVTSSRFVVAANRVTAPMEIQLMSSSASSMAFNDLWRYPYFARTVPPDNIQMEVIAKVLRDNDWTYVGVIYTQESYGINAFRQLKSIVNSGGYSCIGIAEGIPYPSDDEALIINAARNVAAQPGVNVVVLLVADPRPILQAIKADGLAGRFVVIGTDAWASSSEATASLADDFAGAITVGFRDALYKPFLNFLNDNLDYNNRLGMPSDWFEEFYQNLHKCYLPEANINLQDMYQDECELDLETTPELIEPYSEGIRTIMATYATANGLMRFSSEHGCGDLSFAECINSIPNSRQKLFNATLEQTRDLLRTNLKPQDDFSLELGYDDRFWNLGYNIYVLKDYRNQYEKIGYEKEGVFHFNRTLYHEMRRDEDPSFVPIVSKCPEDAICDCVIDDSTQPLEVVQPKYMRDHEPRNYFMYDDDTNEQVYSWPIWAIAVTVLTCIGLLVGLLLFFYFIIFYPVKGGTTVLGFMMMLGVFGIYAINFAFFLPASAATCGARQFVMGVVYVIAIAPLFVKAVDNWRFKDVEYSPHRYHGLTNPFALVLITLGIILIQCIIPTEWLILRNPSASMMADSTVRHDWMWCDPHDFYDISLVLSFVFVMFLVFLTAIFAALSWDSENNYFESRWIFVGCVCTAGCFLVWMVVSTNAGPPYRDPAVAIANFVNATCLLLLIPFRKFILLCKFQAEEEKSKGMPIDDDIPNEMYSTVYNPQSYQPDVFQPADSKPNSEHEY